MLGIFSRTGQSLRHTSPRFPKPLSLPDQVCAHKRVEPLKVFDAWIVELKEIFPSNEYRKALGPTYGNVQPVGVEKKL